MARRLVTTPGESAELRIRRNNIAERLYRVTGVGIYRDSVLLGRDVPIEHPLFNAQVAGSDSVNSIVFATGSIGSGETPTARPIRWECFTCRAPFRNCRTHGGPRPAAGRDPGILHTRRRLCRPAPARCRAKVLPGSTACASYRRRRWRRADVGEVRQGSQVSGSISAGTGRVGSGAQSGSTRWSTTTLPRRSTRMDTRCRSRWTDGDYLYFGNPYPR